jgi:hypothetical protein
MKYICFLVLLLFSGSCIPLDRNYSIWLQNNASYEIWYLLKYNYPDTVLPQSNSNVRTLLSGKKDYIIGNTHKWEDTFNDFFPNDTLVIFFFNSDIINSYNWETIRLKYKILERREYSKSDLAQLKWTITYP